MAALLYSAAIVVSSIASVCSITLFY